MDTSDQPVYTGGAHPSPAVIFLALANAPAGRLYAVVRPLRRAARPPPPSPPAPLVQPHPSLTARTSLTARPSCASADARLARASSVPCLAGRCRPAPAAPAPVVTGLASPAAGRAEWADRLRMPHADAVLVTVMCAAGVGGGEGGVVGSAVVDVREVGRCGARGEKFLVGLEGGAGGGGRKKAPPQGVLEVYGEDRTGVMRVGSREMSVSTLSSGVEEGRKYTLGLGADYLERRSLGRRHPIDAVYYTLHLACDDGEGGSFVSGGGGDEKAQGGGDDGAEDASKWVCVYRSKIVERVRAKRAGGTLDVVYSSSLPLVSQPGTLLSEAVCAAPPSPVHRLGRALGLVPDRRQVFSLPNATFAASAPSQRVKVSIFEARRGRGRGRANTADRLVAHAVFTMDEMQRSGLGTEAKFFVPGGKKAARHVGEVTLLQRSHCHDPEYFGLHAVLKDLV